MQSYVESYEIVLTYLWINKDRCDLQHTTTNLKQRVLIHWHIWANWELIVEMGQSWRVRMKDAETDRASTAAHMWSNGIPLCEPASVSDDW